jgi:hypothetical protein
MIDAGTIISVASITAGFSVTVMMFRLNRELRISDENSLLLERLLKEMPREKAKAKDKWKEQRTRTWLPIADFLPISAILISLLFGVLPLLAEQTPSFEVRAHAAAASGAGTVLLAGYIPSILAHYNFLFRLDKSRPYVTWPEGVFVATTVAGAAVVFRTILGQFG